MGFTVEDMMVIASDKYNMRMIGGREGWANSISWLLMVEDTTITKNFKGKELTVTTGFGFESEEKLLELVRILDEKHAAGLIINTGYYIKEVPASVIGLADECDLPLMTVPWDVEMSEMIKDLTVRIFLQSQTDDQLSASFIKAIENPELAEECRDELGSAFDVDGSFRTILFTNGRLDAMDSVERKRIGYRLQIYLKDISHNAHFFYYDGSFIIILNAVDEVSSRKILNSFTARVRNRMGENEIFVGEGSPVNDISQLHNSYFRAKYAVEHAIKNKILHVRFDDLGVERLTYSVHDSLIMSELKDLIKPILEYDEQHHADLVKTLILYLKYNGSVKTVSEEMYIHKNTIVYRIGKIKELLDTDLDDGEMRIYYYFACTMFG